MSVKPAILFPSGGKNMSYDVAIIGAGVSGAMVARELSRYNIKVALVEKCSDMAMGTTKANSAIVHAGFDAMPGTLKARLNVEGTAAMPGLCETLHVPFKPIGSYVVAFSNEEVETLEELKARGEENGVPGLEILDKEALHREEPNLSDEAVAALYAPTAGIVCPYELTIATVENAVMNGVEFFRNFDVTAIEKNAQGNFVLKSDAGEIEAEYVVNAAGVFCDKVASLIGDDSITIIPRKGEYMLMDRAVGDKVKHTIFQCPSKMGKGVLVTPTVDGNLLVGPSAVDIDEKGRLLDHRRRHERRFQDRSEIRPVALDPRRHHFVCRHPCPQHRRRFHHRPQREGREVHKRCRHRVARSLLRSRYRPLRLRHDSAGQGRSQQEGGLHPRQTRSRAFPPHERGRAQGTC